MTDTVTLYRAVISQTTQFINTLEQIGLLAERFQVDSTLAATCAASATASGRTDLAAADFDNFIAAVVAINSANAGNVKAFFYKLL